MHVLPLFALLFLAHAFALPALDQPNAPRPPSMDCTGLHQLLRAQTASIEACIPPGSMPSPPSATRLAALPERLIGSISHVGLMVESSDVMKSLTCMSGASPWGVMIALSFVTSAVQGLFGETYTHTVFISVSCSSVCVCVCVIRGLLGKKDMHSVFVIVSCSFVCEYTRTTYTDIHTHTHTHAQGC